MLFDDRHVFLQQPRSVLRRAFDRLSGARVGAVMFAAVLLLATAACTSAASTPEADAPAVATVAPSSTPSLSYVATGDHGRLTGLRCEECEPVDVEGVEGPETLLTSVGPVRMYGVFVTPEEENCVRAATERLRELASGSVRLEAGSTGTDSSGTPIRYLYTSRGDSIDELFISEGLARTSAFEGQHGPWLLVTADRARRARAGCIWENFDRFFGERTPRASGGLN